MEASVEVGELDGGRQIEIPGLRSVNLDRDRVGILGGLTWSYLKLDFGSGWRNRLAVP